MKVHIGNWFHKDFTKKKKRIYKSEKSCVQSLSNIFFYLVYYILYLNFTYDNFNIFIFDLNISTTMNLYIFVNFCTVHIWNSESKDNTYASSFWFLLKFLFQKFEFNQINRVMPIWTKVFSRGAIIIVSQVSLFLFNIIQEFNSILSHSFFHIIYIYFLHLKKKNKKKISDYSTIYSIFSRIHYILFNA